MPFPQYRCFFHAYSSVSCERNIAKRFARTKLNCMRKALVVGINKYRTAPLHGCINDAVEVAKLLERHENGSPNFDIIMEKDIPTKSELKTRIKELFKGNCDIALLYFSGHGLEGSFVPSDYNGFSNLVKHSEVTDIFKQCKAKHRIVFADACHSGSMLAMRTANVQDTVDKYFVDRNRSICCSEKHQYSKNFL